MYIRIYIYILPIAYCLLPIVYCLLPIAYCLLPIAYCLLPIVYCLLPIAYCILPIAYCPLPSQLPIVYCPIDSCLPGVADVGAVPDIPIIHKILTNIGLRFGHQSGLYESSGQNSAAILIAYSFRVYSVFSKICMNSTYPQKYRFFVENGHVWKKVHRLKNKLRQACSAINSVWGTNT